MEIKAMPTATSDLDYKLRCLEKENNRLLESIRHNRQNALALIAGVLLFVSTTLVSVGEPQKKDLKKADYEEGIQKYLLGEPNSDARAHAVDCLSYVWDTASTITGAGAIITIILTLIVVGRTGQFGVSKATLESVLKDDSKTADVYTESLLTQFDELESLHDSSRKVLVWAYISGLAMILGCFAITFLWIWFGIEARTAP
jgi:hypothetical protein